ncbi:prephenate dehydratase [Marinobacter nanhaiticus D15-8W]|uniref:prephenate dehydratase n=1 Tax=Marinobacter nanhaiticus D15-8W TaxID=626887 RepID=N6WXG2_9GAMM|nr:prephenate dehydratase [Marinobacter nanhaiticus]ENO15732.1 prephenate dehydratase [Marinobacter nanhaiticus D15-8W]BES73411.1 prephenate dehydratase [Marinobacter nanhaiticus D15-8W]
MSHSLPADAAIAFQGHRGAYSHLACQKVFPDHAVQPCTSFIDAMRAVENGMAARAMIPLENSTAGRVEEIYRLIPELKLHLVGEHFEPVDHCLMARPGTRIDDLKTVASHPQALAQCARHIESLGLNAEAMLDTAGAALAVSEGTDPTRGAIASRLAAELYGLEILDDQFQDVKGNTTRFIILSGTEILPEFRADQAYITSIVFRVRNIPAALYKALGGFATNGVNMVKLESYILGSSLSASQFHVDIEGHVDQRPLQLALEELQFFAEDLRILGTYEAHPFRASRQFRD